MKIDSTLTKWTPMKALGKAERVIDELGVPNIKMSMEESEELEFSNLMNAENSKLENFLMFYGGYKAYLESQVADCDAKKSALEAAFDEGLATAAFKLNKERESVGKKKATKDEVRGEALDTYDQLRELRREVIEEETIHKKLSGLLNAYKAAYDSVSRIVALRTYGTRTHE